MVRQLGKDLPDLLSFFHSFLSVGKKLRTTKMREK